MPINYAALAAEITTDPNAYGLAALRASGSDQGIADQLNQARAGISVDRGTVPAHEVFEAISPAEWAALSAAEKQRVQTVLAMGTVNLRGTNTRASLAAAFGAGSTTRPCSCGWPRYWAPSASRRSGCGRPIRWRGPGS